MNSHVSWKQGYIETVQFLSKSCEVYIEVFCWSSALLSFSVLSPFLSLRAIRQWPRIFCWNADLLSIILHAEAQCEGSLEGKAYNIQYLKSYFKHLWISPCTPLHLAKMLTWHIWLHWKEQGTSTELIMQKKPDHLWCLQSSCHGLSLPEYWT